MNNKSEKDSLRQHAESLTKNDVGDYSSLSADEINALVHELNVHQIELKMQNDQLRLTQEALVQSKNSFANLFENAPVGYLRLDENGGILQSNQTLQGLLGYSADELKGKYLANYIHHDDRGMFAARFRAFYNRPDKKVFELKLSRKNQASFDVEIKGRLVDGTPFQSKYERNRSCLLINIVEITKRKQAEDELELAAKVFENSEEGILIVDPDSKILKVNFSFSAITGYEANEVIGKTPRILKSGRQGSTFYKDMWNHIKRDGYWQGEIWNRRKNGDLYAEWLSITCVQDKHGRVTHYIGIFSDITLRLQSEKQVEKLAHFDVLTDLPNRVLLNDRLKQAIIQASRRKQYLSVLFLDLDHFKAVNNTFGYFIGDMLLQEVARRLLSCVRESDTVARFGGDEFVIILADFENELSATDKTAEIAQKVLNALSSPCELQENHFVTSTSIGSALFSLDGGSVNELIKNADTAMYHAKSQGRNNYQHFSSLMKHDKYNHRLLLSDIQNAILKKQFVVHYQPKIDLQNNGKITGLEALLRWKHPQRGFFPLEQLIPIAEDSGVIMELGAWVLTTACRQLKTWHQQGYKDLTISVNLSAQQFVQNSLIETIRDVLKRTGLEARFLDLEITEIVMMENMPDASRILKTLARMGCTVSLDDFGTGYSSFTYLKKFPVHNLKIDCSFIRNIMHDPDDKAIVSSILSIAQHMRLNVVAEGIETKEQADYLIRQGCQVGQGYYFCKPLPAEQVVSQFSL